MNAKDFENARKQNLKKIVELGIEPYPNRFNRKHCFKEVLEECASVKNGEKSNKEVLTAGRVIGKRNFGKLFFLDIMEEEAKLQIVASLESIGKKAFSLLSLTDTGDFIGVQGLPGKTKRGEKSVFANKIFFLSKSLLPLPEKWHGLKDIETRYRKRHLDLIVNPETKQVFKTRAKIITLVRKFLEKQGFLEVELPLLQPSYGGANARPFTTKSHAWKSRFYLSISPELYLKRLITGGFEKVFTISKNFRNEDVDKTHNPEFTMMECYAAYWDYNDMMELTENMFEYIAKEILGKTTIEYEGTKIELKVPWKRITMHEALKELAGIDASKLSDKELKKMIDENELDVEPFKRGLAIAELFEHFCENQLIQPTFITDHPKETTPLCKQKKENPNLIERFEPFINTWEVGNAYTEQNDPQLQEKFFKEQQEQGKAKGENHPPDKDFVEALKQGMPPTGGLGIGIDRLVMLLTNQPTIKDVILFPQMKPEAKNQTQQTATSHTKPEQTQK